jgi:hypothetical protein
LDTVIIPVFDATFLKIKLKLVKAGKTLSNNQSINFIFFIFPVLVNSTVLVPTVGLIGCLLCRLVLDADFANLGT